MKTIRAKMNLNMIEAVEGGETWKFQAVYGGSTNAEDNTYASYTPSGSIVLQVTNKALLGTLKPGQKYFVDFTPIAE
jgi:hypothetical protein